MNFCSPEDDYCPLYNLLAAKLLYGCPVYICAIFVDTRIYTRVHMETRAYVRKHIYTHIYVYMCRGYISHRRSSLYVNCIRNSEYPTNFLHTDHSRISAKRTSIRRSLHHKFRRTWRNAHLVEAPASHLGCTKRAHCFPQCCDSALPIHAFSVFS